MTVNAILGFVLPALLFAAVYYPALTRLSLAVVSPYARADVRKRFGAAVTDALLVVTLWLYYWNSGSLAWLAAGAGYVLLRDSMKGQSVGKLIWGLVVISVETGRPCTLTGAIWRNVLFLVPGANVVAVFLESIGVVRDPQGQRLGDKLARTQVVEGLGVKDLAASFQEWVRTFVLGLDPVVRRPRRKSAGASRWAACVLASLFNPGLLSGPDPEINSCAALTTLAIPDVAVTSARLVPEGPFGVPGARAGTAPIPLPAFCRVIAVGTPTSDSEINFEVWIPEGRGWNRKLQGVDTGGFQGAINYAALAAGVRRGYATVATDAGHRGDDLSFALGHPEKIVDWAHRSVHLMSEAGKVIVRRHTGRLPDHAYFNGCATGGHQAMMEVQRYPNDYDGVVAGSPAADRTNEIAGYLWAWLATHAPDGRRLLSNAKLRLLTRSAVAACDASDGVTDGVIDDPRRCRFEPASLRCAGADTISCLTSAEIEAVRKVYAGPKNPRTGEQIFPGWPAGSEAFGEGPNDGWRNFIDLQEPRRVGLFRYFVFENQAWDWATIDWDRDIAFTDSRVGYINAVARDLSPFRRRGGKILMYAGWVDPILPAPDVIKYYEEAADANGGPARTNEFFRLFLAPGMGHCSGGPGPDTLDALAALETWVERGVAPERIVASRLKGALVERTRPLCAYPKVARWTGRGSTDEAANFQCVDPPR